MNKETAYLAFIGETASEDDNGWTKEVWEAAWQAAETSFKELKNNSLDTKVI